jgi:hypothetical protein
MGRTLATLFSISTYGTWLRGDARGWVEDGIILPEAPALQSWDRARMAHQPYLFPRDRWWGIAEAIGQSLRERLDVRVYGLTVQSWHAHCLIGATRHDIADVIKCAKDAARWHLEVDRPIWAEGYDKRWCFSWPTVGTRLRYVERHNVRNGWDAAPWPFLTTPPELTTWLAEHPI